MGVLGLDIGGANLKVADTAGNSGQCFFPIWKSPEKLVDQLRYLIEPLPRPDQFAVTMTAELADCYRTKADGIRQIVSAVETIANGIPVVIWSVNHGLIPSKCINDDIPSLAASNWHALATWLANRLPGSDVLLMDIGSTTSDIIPLGRGRVLAKSKTDFERLVAGELVYTGIRRTPLCAVAQSMPVGGVHCSLAAELFATMHDVYLLLGDIPEDPGDCDTANGRPATQAEAYDRLVRQFCCDRTEISEAMAINIAKEFADVQERQISTALSSVLQKTPAHYQCQTIVISGSGRFLAHRVITRIPVLQNVQIRDISEMLQPALPECACAYAVAKLAEDTLEEQA